MLRYDGESRQSNTVECLRLYVFAIQSAGCRMKCGLNESESRSRMCEIEIEN